MQINRDDALADAGLRTASRMRHERAPDAVGGEGAVASGSACAPDRVMPPPGQHRIG